MTSSKHRGFSLLEMLIVISIGLIMAGVTFVALMPLFKSNHVDQGYDTLVATMRTYRNLSIAQSKRYIIIFTPPRTVQVEYWGVGVPVSPAPVPVASFTLPTDISYGVQTGFPNPGPDSFGSGNTAVTVNSCALVTQNCVIFYPDGSAQDDQGNYNNGVIYLTRTGDLYSSRAVTIWGTTGRMRGWRLYNQSGVNTWVQQ